MDSLYLCVAVLFLVLYIISHHFLHKLQNFPPSPFPALPFIGHLYLLGKPFHRALFKVSNRYGPVVFLQFGSRPVLLVSSPSAAEECFTKNDIIFANRPDFLSGKHFGYNFTSLAWSSYGEHWRNLRRISSLEVLSSYRIQALSSIRADEINYLIRRLFRVLLQAGSDTSAATLEWAFSHLLDNPQILKKAQAEIDKHVVQDRLFEESDLAELPYIRCIINETLRMHPAAPLLVPHLSSAECKVAGYRVPRGTVLLVNAWGIHNDPKVWEDPEKFNPDRFIGFEGVKEGCKYIPFGSGRRGCPGENLAIHIIGFALGSLLQCFEWEKPNKGIIDMSEGTGFTLSPKVQPLLAKCSPRTNMVKLLSEL